MLRCFFLSLALTAVPSDARGPFLLDGQAGQSRKGSQGAEWGRTPNMHGLQLVRQEKGSHSGVSSTGQPGRNFLSRDNGGVDEHGESKSSAGRQEKLLRAAPGAEGEAVEHGSWCQGRTDYTRRTWSPRTVTDWMEGRRERRRNQLSALG